MDSNKTARDVLLERQHAYRTVFAGPMGEQVLSELAQFCRAEQTCFHADPRLHAVLEGRREVWLRLQEYLKLDVDELLRRRALPSSRSE